jgi:hypothetical protein
MHTTNYLDSSVAALRGASVCNRFQRRPGHKQAPVCDG